MVRKIVAKGLLKEVGRSEAVGRPILYGTTSEFLDYFDLATIEDLPSIEEFQSPSEDEETDLYQSKYKETEEVVEWKKINDYSFTFFIFFFLINV